MKRLFPWLVCFLMLSGCEAIIPDKKSATYRYSVAQKRMAAAKRIEVKKRIAKYKRAEERRKHRPEPVKTQRTQSRTKTKERVIEKVRVVEKRHPQDRAKIKNLQDTVEWYEAHPAVFPESSTTEADDALKRNIEEQKEILND